MLKLYGFHYSHHIVIWLSVDFQIESVSWAGWTQGRDADWHPKYIDTTELAYANKAV